MLLIPVNQNGIKFELYSDFSGWSFFDHPSTQGCLQYLYKLGCQDKDVLDIGCGAGILEVVSGILGAKSITATDILPGALGLTFINCSLNKINVQLKWAEEPITEKYDIVIMNVEKESAITYLDKIKNYLKDDGKAIITFQNRIDFERELAKVNSSLEIIEENDLPNYKTFILEVDE